MAPTYKLTYFGVQALGEPIRWLLSYGNQKFEDIRLTREDWVAYKPTTPFGQVPILEIDGKKYFQSAAISRYLAREFNLVGKTNLDALEADIVVDTISDFRVPLASYHYDADEASKKQKLEPLLKETVPFFLTRFEKRVKENNGYFVNGQLTWADVYFASIAEYLELMANGTPIFKDYPSLSALRQKVLAIPQIKEWVAKRPANLF